MSQPYTPYHMYRSDNKHRFVEERRKVTNTEEKMAMDRHTLRTQVHNVTRHVLDWNPQRNGKALTYVTGAAEGEV
uniref:Uncharacterized protein n=1 Tax=Arion vulgaris TaxID=1028688 RepID=A0A0B7ATZ6_9EUPU